MPTPVGVNRVGLTRKPNARIASYLTTALAFMVRLDGRCAVEQVRKAVGVQQVLGVRRSLLGLHCELASQDLPIGPQGA
jgi:hypothetical protein